MSDSSDEQEVELISQQEADDDEWEEGEELTPQLEEEVNLVRQRAVSGVHGRLLPRDTLHGSVIVLPQVARCLSWHPVYIGYAVKALLALIIVFVVQGLFVYEVYRLVEAQDLDCWANQTKCELKGFRPVGYASLGKTRQRWYLCEPGRAGRSESSGHWLRRLCIVAFVVALFKDLRQSIEIMGLLLELPSRPGHWVVIVEHTQDLVDMSRRGDKKLRSRKDARMTWQVAGMEAHWKIFNFFVLVIPKICIFCGLLYFGALWLMNTTKRTDLILNAVGLCFVLDLDEAVFTAVTNADEQSYMDNLQPQNPFEEELPCQCMGELPEFNDEDNFFQKLCKIPFFGKFRILGSITTFPMMILLISVALFWFYEDHCIVSKADQPA